MGLNLSFRRLELNRLFCKSTLRRKRFLIANFVAKAKSAVATIANAVKAPVFAPAVA